MVAESATSVEVTILMPCLNEAKTVGTCIGKAQRFLSQADIFGEVLIADNGSTDGSREIAKKLSARVVEVPDRGYGAALIGGIEAANGRYVIMGDADNSYDFSALMPFIEHLRNGADLVMGNRFKGGIAPGAMPLLHRYLGNPVLSWIGRLFFHLKVGDFHCGLRGFSRERVSALNLRTTGMEFASEMVVCAALAGYRIDEVPTTLSKDGRSRPPHLRTWQDGWRHLSFLLIYCPKWLFFYPGLFLLALGDFHGIRAVARRGHSRQCWFRHPHLYGRLHCGARRHPSHELWRGRSPLRDSAQHAAAIPPRFSGLLTALTLERMLIGSAVVALSGLAGVIWCILQWASIGFGPLEYSAFLRILILSLTCIAIGVQLALTGFLLAIVEIPVR